jgi:hypothetical protein
MLLEGLGQVMLWLNGAQRRPQLRRFLLDGVELRFSISEAGAAAPEEEHYPLPLLTLLGKGPLQSLPFQVQAFPLTHPLLQLRRASASAEPGLRINWRQSSQTSASSHFALISFARQRDGLSGYSAPSAPPHR